MPPHSAPSQRLGRPARLRTALIAPSTTTALWKFIVLSTPKLLSSVSCSHSHTLFDPPPSQSRTPQATPVAFPSSPAAEATRLVDSARLLLKPSYLNLITSLLRRPYLPKTLSDIRHWAPRLQAVHYAVEIICTKSSVPVVQLFHITCASCQLRYPSCTPLRATLLVLEPKLTLTERPPTTQGPFICVAYCGSSESFIQHTTSAPSYTYAATELHRGLEQASIPCTRKPPSGGLRSSAQWNLSLSRAGGVWKISRWRPPLFETR